MTLQRLSSPLNPVDALIVAFAFLLAIFCIFFAGIVHVWLSIIFINAVTGAAIIGLSYRAQQGRSGFWRLLHDWYPVPVIFFSFKEMYIIIQSFGTRDYDNLLIAIDHRMFGVHPTIWLTQFASPLLTEVLQISYASFYFLMFAVGFEVFRRRSRADFAFVMFTFLYGFFLSYVGYLLIPAVGPRFTLHNFDTLNTELPGLCVTNFIRDFINAGESIPRDVANPIMYAQRDAFPSGHTEMTLLVMYLAARFRLKSRYALYTLGTLLIISTVYLRYHYVVDLVGGAAFMALTVSSGPTLIRWWKKIQSRIGAVSRARP